MTCFGGVDEIGTFIRNEGLSMGMTSAGWYSSLAKRERTCPSGKNRLWHVSIDEAVQGLLTDNGGM